MSYTKSRAQRRAAFVEMALQAFDNLENWYDQHPEASFGEIEAEARRQRRELMGQALAVLINGRDTGLQTEAPVCESCGQRMQFEGYRPWTLKGLEGDTQLMRAYYVCATCSGQTFFPPGSETETPSGSLE